MISCVAAPFADGGAIGTTAPIEPHDNSPVFSSIAKSVACVCPQDVGGAGVGVFRGADGGVGAVAAVLLRPALPLPHRQGPATGELPLHSIATRYTSATATLYTSATATSLPRTGYRWDTATPYRYTKPLDEHYKTN